MMTYDGHTSPQDDVHILQSLKPLCHMICSRSLALGATSDSESIDNGHTGMSSSLIAQANELYSFQ